MRQCSTKSKESENIKLTKYVHSIENVNLLKIINVKKAVFFIQVHNKQILSGGLYTLLQNCDLRSIIENTNCKDEQENTALTRVVKI